MPHAHNQVNIQLPSVLPPDATSLIPQSTDEEEEARDGQELIPIEGIFIASSDGIAIIISPLKAEDEP